MEIGAQVFIFVEVKVFSEVEIARTPKQVRFCILVETLSALPERVGECLVILEVHFHFFRHLTFMLK